MKDDVVISAAGLGKRYRLGIGRRHDSLRDLLAERASSLFRGSGFTERPAESFWALNDVSFDIRRGESVGIVGLNGAGKSTLLKILSRITVPTAGTARTVGRVGALLEVGTGFHGELTGRENTYLYGAILGMGKAEISRKFEAIVEFAGIKDFIDTPVKRYSSGMYVRLAFAVAAYLEPEILLLDEVLSVGDLPFQRKCMEFAKELQHSDATILFVSHNLFSIKTMCERVIYLKHGSVQFDGPTEQGIQIYEEDCRLSSVPWTKNKPDEWPIVLTGFELFDENSNTKTLFDYGERIKIRLRYEIRRSVESPNFIIAFIRSDGVACCNYSMESDGMAVRTEDCEGVIELITPPLKLVADLYTIHVLVREKGFQQLLCAQIGSVLHIRHDVFDSAHFGVFHESAQWFLGNGECNNKAKDNYF